MYVVPKTPAKTEKKPALAVVNYLLIVSTAIIGCSGFVRGAGDDFSVLDNFTGLLLPVLACVFAFYRSFREPDKKLGVHYFIWPLALVLLSRSLFTIELPGAYGTLLAGSVMMAALARKESVWLIVFTLAVVSYIGQLIIGWGISEYAAIAVDPQFYIKTVRFAIMTALVGAAPWLILRRKAEAQERELNKTFEEIRNNAIADAMTRARLAQEGQKQRPTDTAIVSKGSVKLDTSGTDTITLLSVGNEGVNVQLKSVLFFIRYNFKGLTAAAFIYDSSRRALILNCHDTKGGISIVEGAQVPFGAGVIGQVASDNKLFMSGDLSLYQGSDLHYYPKNATTSVSSILAAPIIDPNSKEFMGVLSVDSINKNAFNEHDKELMRRFSIIASALIANIRMNLLLEQAAKVFRVFYEVSHQFSIALKKEEIFNVLMEMAPKVVPACARQIVILHNPETNSLRLQHIGGNKGELAEGMEFSANSGGIYSYAFNKICAVNIPDLQAQRSYRFVPEEPQPQGVRSLLTIPIVGGEERNCIGLYSIESGVPGLFRSEIEQHITTIIENASVTITRALLYLKMETLATTDGLTGLNNHRTFQEIMARELERSKRNGRKLSLMLTDIDHFKSFNDTYGHPVGDLVLREIAGLIKNTVRLNDVPARYGGEEFCVILPETDEHGAMIIAERIRQVIEAHVVPSGANMLKVTISIGIGTYPNNGATQQEIIDCADKALYTSKKRGRNRVTLYDPSMANVVG